MRKDGIRKFRYGVITAVLLGIVLLTVYKNIHNTYTGQKNWEPLNNPNLLMAGGYTASTGDSPLLLSIDAHEVSINEVNLDILNNIGVAGFHEARPFMIKGEYKIALGSYTEGKLILMGSSDPNFHSLRVELEEAFYGERVRAVYSGDINGDGQDDVIVGTRPSGIVKYYTYADGKWTGSEIDKLGMSIHDIIIANVDGNGNRQIFVTASTTSEYHTHKLLLKTPQIIKYTLRRGVWDKMVIWEPEHPILQDKFPHLYAHPRYIFAGNFTGNGQSELVSGVIGDPALTGLLLLRWNGSRFSQYFYPIEGGVLASTEVITSGDIDRDGKDEILLPTLTDDAMLLFKWQGNTWERSVIAKDLVDKKYYNETIMSMAILDSVNDGYKKMLYVTANGDLKDGKNPKFYTLTHSAANNEWERMFVASPSLPMMETWGIFPMANWKVSPTPNP